MNILVIAPHPDDEVLGCGGTIAKLAKRGHDVFLCIVTKAYAPDYDEDFIKNRPNEVKQAGSVLGVKETIFLDLPTFKLDTLPQKELNDARIELSRGVWWQMAAATMAIFLLSLALNIFGDALRDSLDPKLRTE